MGWAAVSRGAAPSVVWASTLLLAVAFPLLLPAAVWVYTLVFIFSALWFAHYCLAALQALRVQGLGDGQVVDADAVPQISEASSMNFGVIIIGDEILSGRRSKHLAQAISMLRSRGLSLAYAERGRLASAHRGGLAPRFCLG